MRRVNDHLQPNDSPGLPADHVFVLQFHGGTEDQVASTGRVEHLVSGECMHFDDWLGLEDFVKRILHDDDAQPTD